MQIEEATEIMNNFIKDTPKLPFECLMNKEVEAVETLINYVETMHSELDRLEGIEDNTAMLKMELEKKDKVIDEMAKDILHDRNEWVEFDFEKYKDIEEVKEEYYEKVSDNK